MFKCPRCEKMYDFPNDQCDACGQHHHMIFMADKKLTGDLTVCSSCWYGRWEFGRQWRRKMGTWKPDLAWFPNSWDDPEWHDMDAEWKNSTIQHLWIEDEYDIEEL
jgi:hypothetical protein